MSSTRRVRKLIISDDFPLQSLHHNWALVCVSLKPLRESFHGHFLFLRVCQAFLKCPPKHKAERAHRAPALPKWLSPGKPLCLQLLSTRTSHPHTSPGFIPSQSFYLTWVCKFNPINFFKLISEREVLFLAEIIGLVSLHWCKFRRVDLC